MAVAAHKQLMLRSIGSYLVYPAPRPLLFLFLFLFLSFVLFFFNPLCFCCFNFSPFSLFLVSLSLVLHFHFPRISSFVPRWQFHVPTGRNCHIADPSSGLFRALSPLAIVTLTGSMPFGR